jgi:glycosyltransferase involved in cell wall biosynthesis
MSGPILLLDSNASWVRSFFHAVAAAGTEVRALELNSLGYRPRAVFAGILQPWRQTEAPFFNRTIIVPGWSRFRGLSTYLATSAVRRCIRRFGMPRAIVYTLPQYAGVAETFATEGIVGVYHAHDTFRFYDWNREQTIALERRMLSACSFTLAVARLVQEDLAAETTRPVFYSPDATSMEFIDQLRQPPPIPADMLTHKRPIVGCTGQINREYDWELIGELSNRLPGVSFVFIGPLAEGTELMKEIFARPNVHWLGPRPHQQLPAYLSAFDICFNPLKVNDHNNRRSPLRLYDYLATTKPILSTAIREAFEHEGLVSIGRDVNECTTLLQRMLDGNDSVDQEHRRRYILNNTWEVRAAQFLSHLNDLPQPPRGLP